MSGCAERREDERMVRSLKAMGGKRASRVVRPSWIAPRRRTTTPAAIKETVEALDPGR